MSRDVRACTAVLYLLTTNCTALTVQLYLLDSTCVRPPARMYVCTWCYRPVYMYRPATTRDRANSTLFLECTSSRVPTNPAPLRAGQLANAGAASSLSSRRPCTTGPSSPARRRIRTGPPLGRRRSGLVPPRPLRSPSRSAPPYWVVRIRRSADTSAALCSALPCWCPLHLLRQCRKRRLQHAGTGLRRELGSPTDRRRSRPR